MPAKASLLALLAVGAPLLLSSPPALADGDKPSSKTDDTKKKVDDRSDDDTKKKDGDAKKDDDKKGDKDKATAVDDQFDPFEDPNKTYRFIGIRYRDAIAPQFIMNWFAKGGATVNVPMVGPVFFTRKDHLQIAVSLMYADYGMSPTLFQSNTDPSTSWELIQSQLKLGYLMVDLMYEIPIEKRGEMTGRGAFLIGGGVGVAGVFGQLYRSYAYPTTQGGTITAGNTAGAMACNGTSDPAWTNAANTNYCGARNTPPHYAPNNNLTAGYSEPSWANGGSKPLIFPWIALPQIGFRYKPIKQLEFQANGGFSTSGFFFDISGSYGIPTS
jgi:hypothetical protein